MDEWLELGGGDTFEQAGEQSLTDPPLDDHLWIFAGENVWDLGPGLGETGSGGVDHTLARSVDGQVTVYTDTDADGQVDRITELGAAGEYAVTDLDPGTGRWLPTQLGRMF
ncbi:hypothetical protein GOHSU_47_00260 [Gordonia hirsuta DSM 44140 = NBRC 16056]|uniref:Uncharacterized protein n=1 Tax=Gordonia hirsuta DSM 44140 = NBRC 16056 TaxID=1121927 RepID=L7LC84_9ACTN|nr:hypothetical protein [Gordonia hirsuta]GAC58740.1 hypothetical protein GOHSU_47_00260 [Gordonia hirsuta DSM 44140 = NBRC 16056]